MAGKLPMVRTDFDRMEHTEAHVYGSGRLGIDQVSDRNLTFQFTEVMAPND